MKDWAESNECPKSVQAPGGDHSCHHPRQGRRRERQRTQPNNYLRGDRWQSADTKWTSPNRPNQQAARNTHHTLTPTLHPPNNRRPPPSPQKPRLYARVRESRRSRRRRRLRTRRRLPPQRRLLRPTPNVLGTPLLTRRKERARKLQQTSLYRERTRGSFAIFTLFCHKPMSPNCTTCFCAAERAVPLIRSRRESPSTNQ